jgi:predicted branched-subunit amino acid permease
MWAAWQISSWTGIFAGALIPKDWSLEFAATLGLIALLIPLLFDRAVVWGALAAGGVALISAKLPLNLGLLAAIAVGVAVGLAVARLGPRKEERRV